MRGLTKRSHILCPTRRNCVGSSLKKEDELDASMNTQLVASNMSKLECKSRSRKLRESKGSCWNLCCPMFQDCSYSNEGSELGTPLTPSKSSGEILARGSVLNSSTTEPTRNSLSTTGITFIPANSKYRLMTIFGKRRSILTDKYRDEFLIHEVVATPQCSTKTKIICSKINKATNNLENHETQYLKPREISDYCDENDCALEGKVDETTLSKSAQNFTGTQTVTASTNIFQYVGKDELQNGPSYRVSVNEDSKLLYTLESCEKRVERLHSLMKWLQKEKEALQTTSTLQTECQVTSAIRTTNFSSGMVHSAPAETPLEARNHLSQVQQSQLENVEKQMNRISERIRELKFQIESYAYLSWLGLTPETHQGRVVITGRGAPMPNPQLQMIRRTDLECRTTIQEYIRLCQSPISEKIRNELRKATFNNWPWSEAWLIRFVRQMFVDLALVTHFQLQPALLDRWLCDVYRRYNRVPFHNYLHAFMVCQMAYAILWAANLTELLDKEEQLIIIVAAICHDLDHPGFNNAYQINAGTELAMRYNDQSPLENHHASMAFDILSKEGANPFAHFDKATFRRIREGIIRCILATDMSRHNDILSQFKNVVLTDLETAWRTHPESNLPIWTSDKTLRDLVMMVYIKVCDISNECRPLNVAGPWIDRLLSEFFHQGDYEKLVGLPVAPFMDREKVTKAASQCGFIRFVILPLFEAFAELFPPLKEAIVQPAYEQLNYYTELSIQELPRATDDKHDDVDKDQD